MSEYGYKVCYREKGKKKFVRLYLCNTYGLAEFSIKHNRHVLRNPTWKIVPVTRKEVEAGIWNDCPF